MLSSRECSSAVTLENIKCHCSYMFVPGKMKARWMLLAGFSSVSYNYSNSKLQWNYSLLNTSQYSSRQFNMNQYKLLFVCPGNDKRTICIILFIFSSLTTWSLTVQKISSLLQSARSDWVSCFSLCWLISSISASVIFAFPPELAH